MRSVAMVFGLILAFFYFDSAHAEDFFTAKRILLREGAVALKWQALLRRHAIESTELDACRSDPSTCTASQKNYLALLEIARGKKPGILNRAINYSIRYTGDFSQHGHVDVWSTPLETLATGRGDCEDYAILKFLLFKDAGVPAEDRRLIITREKNLHDGKDRDHMLLALKVEGTWLLLDSRHLSLLGVREMTAEILFVLDESDVHLTLRKGK